MIKLNRSNKGVTLAQLVKASAGQAEVQRFEPHLRHNWFSCGVFLVKSRHFGLPLAHIPGESNVSNAGACHNAKLAISLSGCLCRYTSVEYLQNLPEESRTNTVQSLSGL